MAKSPDPRKKPYHQPEPEEIDFLQPLEEEVSELPSDDEAFAALMAEAGPLLDPTVAVPPSSEPESEVLLGESEVASPQPPSGESSFEWANLVEESPSSGGSVPVTFDSPSDLDVLHRALAEEAGELDVLEAPLSDEEAIAATVQVPLAGGESSRVNLTEPLYEEAAEPVPLAEPVLPAEDLLLGMPIDLGLAGASGINLGDPPPAEPVLEESFGESGLDLGGPGVVDVSALEEQAAAALLESGLDLAGPEVVEVVSAEGQSGLDLGSSIPLFEEVAGPEYQESGINLSHAPPVLLEPDAPSSSLDLGSSAVVEVLSSPSSSALDLGASPQGAVIVDSSSALDLDGAGLDDGAGGSVPPQSSASDIFVGADESGIDLGGAGVGGAVLIDNGAGLGGAVVIEDSTVGMGGAIVIEDSSSSLGVGGAVLADEPGSELLDLGAGALPIGTSESSVDFGQVPSKRGSSRDLIAEAVESGVDLGGGMLVEETPESEPFGEEVLLAGSELVEEESSAVNLGASPVIVMEDEVEAEVQGAVLPEEGSSPELLTQHLENIGGFQPVEEDATSLEGGMVLEEPEAGEPVEVVEEEVEVASGEVDEEFIDSMFEDDEPITQAPVDSSGEVELGGPTEEIDDSAEGTLADTEQGDGFLGDMDDLLGGGVTVEEDEVTDIGVEVEEEAEAFSEAREEAEEEEEEEQVRPIRPKYGRRWVGGILLGGLLTAAAAAGVLLYDGDMPNKLQKLREMAGIEDEAKAKAGPRPGSGGGGGPQGGPQVADIRDLLKNAEFDQKAPDIKPDNGDERAALGQFLWMQHVSRSTAPKAEDEPVKTALDHLKQAIDNPATSAASRANALLCQGQIHETLNNRAEAETAYKKGLDAFIKDDTHRPRFEGALNRLDVLLPVKKPAPEKGARLPVIDHFPLALELIPAQMPPMGGGEKPLPEAGWTFWKAWRLHEEAQRDPEKKFAAAIEELKRAQKEHEARRATRLGKAQNPDSDPLERIFEKACEQLIDYWTLQDRLKGGGYLTEMRSKPVDAVDAALGAIKKAQEDVAKLKEDAKTLEADRKKAETERDTAITERDKIKKEAADSLTKIMKLEKDLDEEKKKVLAEAMKLRDAEVRIARIQAQRKELEDTIVAVGDKVGLRDIDAVTSRPILFERVDDVMAIVKEKDPSGKLLANIFEIRDLNGTLKNRWAPEIMLGYWLPLLGERSRKDIIEPALRDAQLVKEAKPAPALGVRAQALAIEGLALWNRGDYDRARTALTEAVRGDVPESPWKPTAKGALDALTSAGAYYLPQAEILRSGQRFAAAVDLLSEGIRALPDQAGELLALRSQVRLEMAQARGEKVTDTTPGVKEADEDARSAIRAGAKGTGEYAAGRLAEAMGQFQPAMQAYRRAIEALPADHVDSSRARLALARVLLKAQEIRPAQQGGGKMDKVGRLLFPAVRELVTAQAPPCDLDAPAQRGPAFPIWHPAPPARAGERMPLRQVVPRAAELPAPEEEAALREAIRLADEVLARPDINNQPLLKARALAVKGLWTEALNTYVRGLKPHLSPEHFEGLRDIVDNHPAQRRPDREPIPHPKLAERHYGEGLNLFWAKDFAGAEKEFIKAVANFDRDARYHYFLGLARQFQGKRGGEDLAAGARLEADNRPHPAFVNRDLERIQGQPRNLINEARRAQAAGRAVDR